MYNNFTGKTKECLYPKKMLLSQLANPHHHGDKKKQWILETIMNPQYDQMLIDAAKQLKWVCEHDSDSSDGSFYQ